MFVATAISFVQPTPPLPPASPPPVITPLGEGCEGVSLGEHDLLPLEGQI